MAEEEEVVSSSRRPFPVVDSDSEVTKALVRFKHACCIIILYVDLKQTTIIVFRDQSNNGEFHIYITLFILLYYLDFW